MNMGEDRAEKRCPCDTVIKLQSISEEQQKRLNELTVNLATINTKLNFIIGVLSVFGSALVGVTVKMIF